MLYRAQEGFVNLHEARQSQIGGQQPQRRSPSSCRKGEEEGRFGKVAASEHSQNLTERGIKRKIVSAFFAICSFFIFSSFQNWAQQESVLFTLPDQTNEWQFRDENRMILPWYTKPFLDELKTWDISSWDILECGAGHSTIWLASHCNSLVSIEDNQTWATNILGSLKQKGLTSVDLRVRNSREYQLPDGTVTSAFINAIDEDQRMYDCVIIDGASRNLCVKAALKHLKPRGIIIFDNANQGSCAIDASPTLQLLSQYEHYSYLQPGHRDWKTDYWIIDQETPYKKVATPLKNSAKNRRLDNALYGTHMAPLITALVNTTGPVLEMGCGDYSTPLLHALCSKDERFLLSTDTSRNWIELFIDLERGWHCFQYVPCFADDWQLNPQPNIWDHVGKEMNRWGVVLIDHRPGERRVRDIQRMRNKADIIVVHDTEQPSYNYEPTLSSFKYRYDYVRYATRTTLVSETIDVAALFD